MPAHTPFPFVVTQVPLNDTLPLPQITQSVLVGPVQVWHSAEQAVQFPLALKLPSGQAVPSDLVCAAASHWVRSFGSCVNPVEQAIQSPVESAQDVHPSWQASQLPAESRKKPVAHLAHAVPFDAVVHPGRHVHCPLVPHSPLRQLQLAGGLVTGAVRHLPLPAMPSSQVVHPLAHGLHVGPKNPVEQVSQEVPLNPVGQIHVPDAEHTLEPEQGGEHAEDSMSTSEREPAELVGNCVKSGTESQRITRLLSGPAFTATQTFEAMARESAVMGTDVLDMGVVGRAENEPWPA